MKLLEDIRWSLEEAALQVRDSYGIILLEISIAICILLVYYYW